MTQNTIYILASIMLLVVIFLLYLLIKYKKEIKNKNNLIIQHEEKIKYLRQISAENEHRKTAIEHETEKEIIALKHKIEGLEIKMKEGTKNQVVAMIEAQRNKRARALKTAELSN